MQKRNLSLSKKKPALNLNQMSPFHASMYKKSKNPNFKGTSKQTYCSFIIKMLDETPINFNKSIRKISNTAYKNLLKKKTRFNPFNTDYSPTKRNNVSSFEKVLNKIENKVLKKNEYLKEYKNKNIIEPISQRNKTHNFNFNEDSVKKKKFVKNNSSLNFNFNSKSMKEKINLKNTYSNIKKKRLNDLYGYDSNFIKSKNHLLKKKKLLD